MADLVEWFKGITFFIFGGILFYFLWTNVFSNILSYIVGQDSVLGAFAWVSFVILFLFTVPIYLVYTGITGSKNNVKTEPVELLKAIGVWSIMMPFLVVIYLVVNTLITSLNGADIIDVGMEATATTFSWFFALICILALTGVPFYYILKGYGQFKTGVKANENE